MVYNNPLFFQLFDMSVSFLVGLMNMENPLGGIFITLLRLLK